MKKNVFIALSVAASLMLVSCASMPSSSSVLNHGYYTEGETQDEVAKVIVSGNLEITGIDKSSAVFASGVEGWSKKSNAKQLQEFTINPGIHTLSVRFNSGAQYTIFSKVMIAQFVANKEYKVVYKISNGSVDYDVIDTETSESVILDVDSMQGKTDNFMSQFIKAVLNPTMEGTDKTVIEENDDFVLTNLPNMKYELKNKKTNEVEKGFRGFVTDFSFKKGTVYLYETDTIETKDEFLKTDYQKTSKTVLEVVACDTKTVTYKYVKPENLAGTTIKFNISQPE